MKRRTLLAGVVGVAVAHTALAQTTKTSAPPLSKPQPEMVEVKVEQVYNPAQPELSHLGVVLLKARSGEKFLSIWMGGDESNSIWMFLHGEKPFRPLPPDFMAQIVKSLGGDVESVNISRDSKSSAYAADVTVVGNSKRTHIDARPGDAIALAIRLEAPVFVDATLLQPVTLAQADAIIDEQAKQMAQQSRDNAKPK